MENPVKNQLIILNPDTGPVNTEPDFKEMVITCQLAKVRNLTRRIEPIYFNKSKSLYSFSIPNRDFSKVFQETFIKINYY
jgi:hypothetical protein